MAIFLPGHVIGAISGNLQGSNFAQTRNGQVIRKRLFRVRKKTEGQLAQRALFSKVHQDWIDLAVFERLAWNKSASGYKFQNRLGMPFSLSGFGLFKKILLSKNAEGWPDPGQPPIMQRSVPPDSLGMLCQAPPGEVYLIDWVDTPTAASGNVTVWLARPFTSSPINFFNRWYGPTSVTPKGQSYDFETLFTDRWGDAVAGERIGAMISFWDSPYLPSQIVRMATTVV